MQKCGTASQISYNEKWFFNLLCFVPRKEDVIQKETEPMEESPQGPNCIKEQQKYEALTGQAGRCVFPVKERTIKGAPEEAEIIVIVHYKWVSLVVAYTEKAR